MTKFTKKKKEKERRKKEVDRVTKKSLYEEYPAPFLRITPLSDKESLRAFVNRLEHIDRVTIKLLPTNKEEIDNDDFWSDFGRRREEMNSKNAKVEFANVQDGLASNQVYDQASSASSLGNSEIKFKGYDAHGDTIRGSNDDFNLTVELDDLPRDAERAAREKYRQFRGLNRSNVVSIPKETIEVIRKIKSILGRI